MRPIARRSLTVVSNASSAHQSDKSQTSRRFMIGALALGLTASTKGEKVYSSCNVVDGSIAEAFAEDCSFRKPCTPPPREGQPRYRTPGPAYSPSAEAEARFLAKLQAEAAAKEKKATVSPQTLAVEASK
eukprot:6103158-Pyramimonas_sp.AAC.3